MASGNGQEAAGGGFGSHCSEYTHLFSRRAPPDQQFPLDQHLSLAVFQRSFRLSGPHRLHEGAGPRMAITLFRFIPLWNELAGHA